ncbi:porin family protein [Celeribacter persicus]|uniref:Tetratricopeptide repeat protein n=1 Tax=Celeribacter persicus TaxID=1651082 RepID=A0A2T5HJY0_9RHOB|nr:porin family protein [Celeribacter persicus]PTQ71885.1 tetratricopeptide repeat protein [Celeribacter persicus]
MSKRSRRPGHWFRQIMGIAWCVLCIDGAAFADTSPSTTQVYHALMRLGQTALAKEDPSKATLYFSKAYHLVPTDPSAQLAMAEAIAQQGQARKAETFLRQLLKDPAQRANTDFYLKGLTKLQKRYPFVTSASFAALPSTNIKNTSSATIFDTLLGRFEIDDGGEEISGIGIEIGAWGTYRYPLADGLSFELGAGLNRIWYEESELRYWRGRVTVDVSRLDAHQELRGGLHADRSYYTEVEDDSSDRIAMGLHGSWSRPITNDLRLNVSGLAEYRDYLDKDSLSGPYASFGLGLVKRLSSGATVFMGGSVERSRTTLDYHRYWGGTLRAGYETDLTDTLRGSVSLSGTFRQYDTEFSAVDYARRDEAFRIGISLSDRRIKIMGGTPKLSCSYRFQSSNISLYETRSTDCRIGWSYSF